MRSSNIQFIFLTVTSITWAIMSCACGATSIQKSPRRLSFNDDIMVVYSQGAFTEHPSLVQQVVFEQDNVTLEFTAMVEIEDTGFSIAGLSTLGKRQFLMTVSDKKFNYEAEPRFELPFPPQYLMRDFLLVYATPAALRAQQVGLMEQTGRHHRDILRGEAPLIQIDYDAEGFTTGNISLTHRGVGYTLRISTVQVDFPSEMIKTPEEE